MSLWPRSLRTAPLAMPLAMIVSLTLLAGCSGDTEAPPVATTVPATPTATAATSTPTAIPAVPAGSAYAPDGRTGIAELDEIIETLLRAPAEELIARFPEAEARGVADPDASPAGSIPYPEDVYPVEEWTTRLREGGEAALRAVWRERPRSGAWPSREYNILLQTKDGDRVTGWRFAVERGALVDIYFDDESPVWVLHLDPAGSYDLFLVLPPRDELPQTPASHSLSVRTGDASVDRVLELVEAGDVEGLVALTRFDGDGMFLSEMCHGWPIPRIKRTQRAWLGSLMAEVIGVHSVAVAPPGYRPTHGHLVSLRAQTAPLQWSVESMLISPEGELVRMIDRCSREPKPPLAILVPEPVDGSTTEEWRTGIEVVDTFLDAMDAGDIDTMASLVDYRLLACVERPDGIGSPPTCDPGEAIGTPGKALLGASCEGYFVRERDVREMLAHLIEPSVLYAVWDLGEAAADAWWDDGEIQVVIARDAPATLDQMDITGQRLNFSEQGLVSIWTGCGPTHPAMMLGPGQSPAYLLPPID